MVTLFEALGVDLPTPELVARRWAESKGFGLAFPLGMGPEGPLYLDLIEQGPHALVGGTTGAGKSELLRSLVLSLAANHSPARLSFLFVDHRGGWSAEVRDLPHTVGSVTDLSGRRWLRALTSLRAELQRRMQLMEGKAKDLREMLEVAPDEAPPSLVIVVDEFAPLVKEIPDFVSMLVNIAQRGRSLGFHMILATQRPAGAVNDNILANTNLRISLRVLDPVDSRTIVGTNDAADVPELLRGRGYVVTGLGAPIPFQCAWSGAPVVDEPPLASVGRIAVPPTQLDVLVAASAEAARELGLPPAERPWLEPLAEVVSLRSVLDRLPLRELRTDPGRLAVLGISDDPENQAQHVATVDLEDSGGLLVFGAAGSGKTTLLRSLAAGIAMQGTPDEVQIYGLDCSGRALTPIADLPHCAGVVVGDDAEKVARLLTVLEGEIEQRRRALAATRAENLGALRSQTGSVVFPRILVLFDGYGGFHSAFDKADRYTWLSRFQRIVFEGREVGVHVVVTTERRIGLPAALLSAISSRIVLRMTSSDELIALGVPSRIAKDADLPNGRGFIDGETELQLACVSEDPSSQAQAEAIAALSKNLAAAYQTRSRPLPELPDTVRIDNPSPRPLTSPLGVADLTLDVVDVDLAHHNIVVVGPPLSGKSTALATIAWGLRSSTGGDVKLLAMGGPFSPLANLDIWDDTAFSPAGQVDLVNQLGRWLMTEEDEERANVRFVLFVDAAEDLRDSDVLRRMDLAVRAEALRLVVACDSMTLAKAYSGWMSALRRNRSALLLQPESNAEVEALLGVKAALRPEQQFPAGRGIYMTNRQWQLVQVGVGPLQPDLQQQQRDLGLPHRRP